MITLQNIGSDTDWNETDPTKTTSEYSNYRTKMDFAEHQRIVFAARSKITSYSDAAATGFSAKAKRAFSNLKECYETTGSKFVLKVSKGIHQDSNMHIQLTLSRPIADGYFLHRFHLDVQVLDVPSEVISGVTKPVPAHMKPQVKDKNFQWQPYRFTGEFGGVPPTERVTWPIGAVPGTIRARGRRHSISLPVLQAAVDDLYAQKKNDRLGLALKFFMDQHKIKSKVTGLEKGDLPFLRKNDKVALASTGTFTGKTTTAKKNVTLTWDQDKNEVTGSLA